MLAIYRLTNIKVQITAPNKWISNFAYNAIRLSSNISSSDTSDSSDSSDSDNEPNNKNRQIKRIIDNNNNQTKFNESTGINNLVDNLFNKTPSKTTDIKLNVKNNQQKIQEKYMAQIAEVLTTAVGGNKEKILSSLLATFSASKQETDLKKSTDKFQVKDKSSSTLKIENEIKSLEKNKRIQFFNIDFEENKFGSHRKTYKSKNALQTKKSVKADEEDHKQQAIKKELSDIEEKQRKHKQVSEIQAFLEVIQTKKKLEQQSVAKKLLNQRKVSEKHEQSSVNQKPLETQWKKQEHEQPSIAQKLLETQWKKQEHEQPSIAQKLLETQWKKQEHEQPSVTQKSLKKQRVRKEYEQLFITQKLTEEQMVRKEHEPEQPSPVQELLETQEVRKEQEHKQPSVLQNLMKNQRKKEYRQDNRYSQPPVTQELSEKQQIEGKYDKSSVLKDLVNEYMIKNNYNVKGKRTTQVRNRNKQNRSILHRVFLDDNMEDIQRYKEEMEKYPPIFSKTDVLPSNTAELKIWDSCETKYMELIVTSSPRNGFQEMIQLTQEGKLWKFPIDNEQGMEEEHNIHFSEHVFLERHLTGWCPSKGPIRHFMELVCVGLSKNHTLTVKEKYDHIMWYKEYFENKNDLLNKLGLAEITRCNTEKQITSN